MTWTAQGGTATIENGETVVSTDAPFESNLIAVGAGFSFHGEVEHEITDVNPAEREFTIASPYGGSDKVNVPFCIKPYPGAVRAAERALREATEAIELIAAPSATDRTLGRLLRVGDLGHHGQAIELGAGNDLNDVVLEGIYTWTSGNTPLNAPAPSGSHLMEVTQGAGVAVKQTVYRHTTSSPSLIQYWRNVFVNSEGNVVSEWAPELNRYNILSSVSLASGVPTGGLAFTATGTYDVGGITSTYWVKRTFEGWQELQLEVPIDVTDNTPQAISYPSSYYFKAGGKTSGSFSHLTTTPNAALYRTNIEMFASFNAAFSIKLGTAGTSSDTASDAEKLRILITGRWG